MFENLAVRAPLRLGLAGGETDLSLFCDEFAGAALYLTIDRYAHAIIEPSIDGNLHVSAQDVIADEIHPPCLPLASQQLPLDAGVMNRMVRQFCNGSVPPIRLTTFVDAPPGSGLGSSSALVVSMVEAFPALPGPYDDAPMALEIARLEPGLPGGKRDDNAPAFGGVNFNDTSTLGLSANVIRAFRAVRGCGMRCLGLAGMDGCSMRDRCDILLQVPSVSTAVIQRLRFTAALMLCALVELEMCPPAAGPEGRA